MKKNVLAVLLVSMVLAFTACSTPNSAGNVPELTNAFIISESDETIKPYTSNWNDLAKFSTTEITNVSKYDYRLYISYIDKDLDVCELQVSWDGNTYKTYQKFNNQEWENESRYFIYSIRVSDFLNRTNTLYLRLVDANGNYSNVFKIENITMKLVNNNIAPVIEDAFLIPETDEVNKINNNLLEYKKYIVKKIQIKNSKYKLFIIFRDKDIDVTEALWGLSLDKLKSLKFTQEYAGEYDFWSNLQFTEDDYATGSTTIYIKLKDSKGNESNIFEIKDLEFSKL